MQSRPQGTLHILDNAEKAIGQSLTNPHSFSVGLMALAHSVGTKYLRERFVELCFRRVDGVAHEASHFENNIVSTEHSSGRPRWGGRGFRPTRRGCGFK